MVAVQQVSVCCRLVTVAEWRLYGHLFVYWRLLQVLAPRLFISASALSMSLSCGYMRYTRLHHHHHHHQPHRVTAGLFSSSHFTKLHKKAHWDTHRDTHTHTHARTHTHTRTHARMHARTRTHTHKHTWTLINMINHVSPNEHWSSQ